MPSPSSQQINPIISTPVVEEANQALIKWVQKSAFSAELKATTQNKSLSKSSSLYSLCPILRDGVLCVGGRIDNKSGDASRHPVILPRHHFTSLLVREVHEKNAHVGTNHTLSQEELESTLAENRQEERLDLYDRLALDILVHDLHHDA